MKYDPYWDDPFDPGPKVVRELEALKATIEKQMQCEAAHKLRKEGVPENLVQWAVYS